MSGGVASVDTVSAVAWHDLECGGYSADLPLWRELARVAGGPILEIGAGTGRVALDLARAGHEVVALDSDATLLEALAERGRGLNIRAVQADARSFSLGERFALCLVPMQTIQIMGGVGGRRRLLGRMHAHLRSGGTAALAIATRLQAFDEREGLAPGPDVAQLDGLRISSRPASVRLGTRRARLERVREVSRGGATGPPQRDVVHLDRLTGRELEREARSAGFTPRAARVIHETGEHVESTVVMLAA